jgi:four helix bundle protein
LQELDETSYWLELLQEAGLRSGKEVDTLTAEANELISIFVRIVKEGEVPCSWRRLAFHPYTVLA